MVFTGRGLNRVVRVFLPANGLLLPFLALQMYFHPLIWIAALWAVTFPGSTLSLAILFRRGNNTQSVIEGDLEGFNNFRQIVMVSCE